MTPQDIEQPLSNLREKFHELEKALADPGIYGKVAEFKKISREHRRLESLFTSYYRWLEAIDQRRENHELQSSESDEDMREMIQSDLESLDHTIEQCERDIRFALLPPDPNDGKNIIVEIHPAAGGDESALFAGELLRLYLR